MRGFVGIRMHGTRTKLRKEKCKKCGHTNVTEVCPGCGKDLTCRNAKVRVSVSIAGGRSIHVRTHSLKCLEKAIGKESYDAVVKLINGKGSRKPRNYKPTAAQLRTMLKRAEKRTTDIKKEIAKMGKE